MKKIIAKILVLAMLISVLPKVSFAEQEKVEKNHNVAPKATQGYSVIPKFVSGTAGKKLPDGVENQIPQSAIDAPKGFKYKLKTDFKEVKADGGTWKFKRWEKVNADGTTTVVTNEVQVINDDINLNGVWEFEKDAPANKFKVLYRFIAVPDDMDLPEAVKNKKPADKYDVPNGTKINLPKFDDVKVDGGTWKFITWKVPKNNQVEPIENEATVENDDLRLQGEWKFVKDTIVEKYNVTFRFESATADKELPDEVKAKLPENQSGVESGTEITLEKFTDVKVEGGTWKFVGWRRTLGNDAIDVEDKIKVDNQDLNFVGRWIFEEDKKTEPQQKPEVKPNGKNTGKLAKTSISGGLSYALASILALGVAGVIGYKKKDDE